MTKYKVKEPEQKRDRAKGLLAGVAPVAADDITWETLLLASRRTKTSLSDLVQADRDGRIPVGQRKGDDGFHGLVVLKEDAHDLAASCPAPAPSNDVELPGVMSAAEFGRSVGLRDGGNFIALVKAGHAPQSEYRP